jgi:hypothetical protein
MHGDLDSKCQKLDIRMESLVSQVDSQATRLGSAAKHMAKLRKEVTMIQDQMQGLERHIKKQVEESLLKWRVSMDQQHSEFLGQQNNWQSSMQSSISDTCKLLKSKIESVRSNGELATQNMTRILDEQVAYILGQQEILGESTKAQFEQLDLRVQALDSLMEQSQAALKDVKSRQEATAKLHLKQMQMHQGPIVQLRQQHRPSNCQHGAQSALDESNQSDSCSSSQPIQEADVTCRSLKALSHAAERKTKSGRYQLETEINHAQDLATVERGRSLKSRFKAAERLAHSRSASRTASEAD